MSKMLSVSVNEQAFLQVCKEHIASMLKEADLELVFWDSNELTRRTCMSWNTIQSTFFFEPDFPKRKIGSKWYFPARETRNFLEAWILNSSN